MRCAAALSSEYVTVAYDDEPSRRLSSSAHMKAGLGPKRRLPSPHVEVLVDHRLVGVAGVVVLGGLPCHALCRRRVLGVREHVRCGPVFIEPMMRVISMYTD
jgi:hypothetical protein